MSTNKAGQTTLDILATGLLYGAHGAMRRMSLLSGKTEEWCYNSRLQSTRIRVGNAASSQNNCNLAASDSMWLGLGYRTGAANNGDLVSQNIQPVNVNQTFDYDSLGRISGFTDPQFSESYGYDRWGNRWLTARTGGVPNGPSWFEPSKNQMRDVPGSQQPPCPNRLYDCAGSQVDVLGVKLTYDGENRVAEASRTVEGTAEIYKYSYGGDGRRVGTVAQIGGVERWKTAFVYDAMGKLVAEYTAGAGATPAGGRRFVSVDHLGSTRMTMDGSGGNVRRFDYLPFGESLATTSRTVELGYPGAGPRMMFTGKERDVETGLDYFGARYLSSAQGRWTSPDWSAAPTPIPYADLRDPQTLNLYGYVRNNPMNLVDVDGHGFWNKVWNSFSQNCFCEGEQLEEFKRKNREQTEREIAALRNNQDYREIVTSTVMFNFLMMGQQVQSGVDQMIDSATSSALNEGLAEGATPAPTPALPAAAPSSTALTAPYPSNNGFAGSTSTVYLFPGQTIQRYGGSNYSRFFAPAGTPGAALSLPPGTTGQPLNLFQVAKPFPVQSGTVAPYYGQPGFGTQYVTPVNLGTLLKRGVIVRK